MEIKNLSATPVETIIDCFLKSFQNYFVTLPTDHQYWKDRFHNVKVDWSLSFGAFESDKLVCFIINGIDVHNGKLTAYNTGTGVLPEFRGQRLVDKMYEQAFPDFKKNGIEKCLLEVIVENTPAKKVYQRIGFSITRDLRSFSGEISSSSEAIKPELTTYSEILKTGLYDPESYCWESRAEAVRMAEELTTSYFVRNKGGYVQGYFTLGQAGNIIQLEEKDSNYSALLNSVGTIEENVKLKNVASDRKKLISELEIRGFKNTVNQHEMELLLS